MILSLRPQDPLPDWITHMIYLTPELRVSHQGRKEDVLKQVRKSQTGQARLQYKIAPQEGKGEDPLGGSDPGLHMTRRSREFLGWFKKKQPHEEGEPLVEMENICVKYGDKTVLGGWQSSTDGQTNQGLSWTVRRGERWGVFGPNGKLYLSLSLSGSPPDIFP